MNYGQEWNAAVLRNQTFGLRVQAHQITSERLYLDGQRQQELPHIISAGLNGFEYGDLVAQCLFINCKMQPVFEQWLGCPAIFTLGWIDDKSAAGLFKFDDSFIRETLCNGHQGTTANIHAWLTLPSMEVIDITIATSFSRIQKQPAWEGRVLAAHADTFQGFAYKPMLLGTDFLVQAGMVCHFL